MGYSFFFLIGNNIRVESPLFTSKLRRVINIRKVFVFLLGLGVDVLTFLIYNIGSIFGLLVQVLESMYLRFISVLKLFFVLGTSLFYRGDVSNLYYLTY